MKTRFALTVVALAAIFLGGIYGCDRAGCKSKWGSYGLAVDYGVLSGCRVEVSEGRWVPVSAIRDLDVRP